MIASSSHSAYTCGTGTAVCASARMTRYSRSTAWALGSKFPSGLRRRTYVPLAAAELIGRIGLPALEPLRNDRATEPVDVIAHPTFEPTKRQSNRVPTDRCPTRGTPPVADSHLAPHTPAIPTVDCI